MKVSDEDMELIKELQASLKKEGIKMFLGQVAGYAARKVLLK